MMNSRGLVTFVLTVTLLWAGALAHAAEVPKKVAPSANAGKTGSYQVKTAKEGYNYYVYVPKSYSEENPAGLHVFFHGQSSQKTAEWFDRWSKDFLEPYNLIGINMQYMDGDNMKDTEGKVQAAMEAMAQVRADYRILPNRGVVGSFSGGGLPHGLLMSKFGKQRGPNWPFVHSAAYDSNFRNDPKGMAPMSWFIGLGGKEYTLAALGQTQTGLMTSVLADALKGNSPDLYLRIEPEKGHSMSNEDVEASAAQFHRSDLAYCGFVWEPDFAEADLKPIVEQMNQLALGKAATGLTALKARKGLSAELKAKADKLQEKLDARVAAVLELTKQLAADDPVLLAYYGKIFERQLAGHEKAKELTDAIAAARQQKDFRTTLTAFEQFAQKHGGMFAAGQPKVQAQAATWLQQVSGGVSAKSLLGKMAAEYLMLK